MEWLADPLWNLFYLAWIPVLLAYAYYSRHEFIQKLTLCWIAAYIGANLAVHTEIELATNYAVDAAGAFYSATFLARNIR